MTTSPSNDCTSTPNEGAVRIVWYRHNWSGRLAQSSRGAMLALEPRLIPGVNAAHAEATCPYQGESAPRSHSAKGLSLRVKQTDPVFTMEVRTSAPQSLSAYWFRVPSSGDWVRHQRETATTPFVIRGRPRCNGDRVAIVAQPPRGAAELIALFEMTERGGSADAVLRPVTREDAPQLQRFGVSASTSRATLDARNWTGFARVLLENLKPALDFSDDLAGDLERAYWRTAGEALGLSDALVAATARESMALQEPKIPLAPGFSPVVNLEELVYRACADLGCEAPPPNGRSSMSWQSQADFISRLHHSVERGFVSEEILPFRFDAVRPDALKASLENASLAEPLAKLAATAAATANLGRIANASSMLIANFEQFLAFAQRAATQHALKVRLDLLRTEAAAEGLTLDGHVSDDTTEIQVHKLERQLGPVFEVRQRISDLGGEPLQGEPAIDAARRTVRNRLEAVRSDWQREFTRARQVASFDALLSQKPPEPNANIDGFNLSRDLNRATLQDCLVILDAMNQLQDEARGWHEWSSGQLTAIVSTACSEALVGFGDGPRTAALANQFSIAADALDRTYFSSLSDTARQQAAASSFIRKELLATTSIERLLFSGPSVAVDLPADLREAISLLLDLVAAAQRVPESAADCRQIVGAIASARQVTEARSWYGDALKRRLHCSWAFRTQSALRALAKAGIRFSIDDLELLWSDSPAMPPRLERTTLDLLNAHGCLPSVEACRFRRTLWPS
jgi:hypothetical protein